MRRSADVKTESFSARLRVRARWLCPTAHAEEAMQEGGDALDTDWEPEWFPRITVDCATEKRDEHTTFVAARDRDGRVWITGEWNCAGPHFGEWSQPTSRTKPTRASGQLISSTPPTRARSRLHACVRAAHILEAYDLHAFPFDVQDFNIVIRIENATLPIELTLVPSAVKRGRALGPSQGGAASGGAPVRVEAEALELPDFRTLCEREDGSHWLEVGGRVTLPAAAKAPTHPGSTALTRARSRPLAPARGGSAPPSIGAIRARTRCTWCCCMSATRASTSSTT